MSDLWEHGPEEVWGGPDDDMWQCNCAMDVYNPDENTHCWHCGKPKPVAARQQGS